MLFVVSTVFLVLNTPSHVIRVYLFIRAFIDEEYQPGSLLKVIYRLGLHLFNANFAANFLLYSLSGRAFRRATARLARRAVNAFVAAYRQCGRWLGKCGRCHEELCECCCSILPPKGNSPSRL